MAKLGNASAATKNKILEMLGVQEEGGFRKGSVFDILAQKAEQFTAWIETVDLSSFAPKVEAGVTAAFEKAASAVKWFRENSDSVVTALKVLGVAFVAVKVTRFSADMISAVQTISGFIKMVNELTLAKRIEGAEWVKSAALKAKDTAATVAHKTASIASAAATKGLAAAQAVLNVAMSANPIGLVVMAIAALVAAGVALYKNWDTVKAKAAELWSNIKSVFSGIKDSIVNAFNAAKEKVRAVIDWIKDKIQDIPIIGTVYNAGVSAGRAVSGHALGTSYWRGGPTRINERGGEIVNLPNGTQIIPHDVSTRAGKPNLVVNVNIAGNVIGNEAYADYLGDRILGKVKAAYDNL